MSAPVPSFDAPLLLGAQIEARANHPERRRAHLPAPGRPHLDLPALPRRVRAHGALPAAAGSARSTTRGPATSRCCSRTTSSCSSLYGGCGYAGLDALRRQHGPARRHARRRAQPVARAPARRRRAAAGPRSSACADELRARRARERARRCAREGERARRAPTSTPRSRARSGAPGASLDAPAVDVEPDGAADGDLHLGHDRACPKGINNNHFKLLGDRHGRSRATSGSAATTSATRACRSSTRTRCSSASSRPSTSAARSRCASASARQQLRARRPRATASPTGTTSASRCTTCSARSRRSTAATRRASSREVTNNPRNRLRYALGNGAARARHRALHATGSASRTCSSSTARPRRRSAPSARRAIRAAASARSPTRPCKILNERGEECPPARARPRRQDHRTTPRRSARSAASRPTPASSRATSTTRTRTPRSTATASTTRATSATSLERDGKRYLFFDGRTDDWIRKDGENFSALQVARLLQEHPDVVLAAAYGVPCAVSDELVMVALKLRAGRALRPAGVLRLLRATRSASGGMDRKWFPDFVRVVDEFEYTQTEKILVRNLKRVHFDRRRLAGRAALLAAPRRHGVHRPFTAADYEALRDAVRRGGEARPARPLSPPRMPRCLPVLVLLLVTGAAAAPRPCPQYLPRAELTGHVPAALAGALGLRRQPGPSRHLLGAQRLRQRPGAVRHARRRHASWRRFRCAARPRATPRTSPSGRATRAPRAAASTWGTSATTGRAARACRSSRWWSPTASTPRRWCRPSCPSATPVDRETPRRWWSIRSAPGCS